MGHHHWDNAGGTEDIDGDGLVEMADLLIVLANWGLCHGCTPEVFGAWGHHDNRLGRRVRPVVETTRETPIRISQHAQ